MKQLWGCFKFSAILKLAMAKFLVDSTHYCTVMLKHWSSCALLRFKSVVEVPYRFRLQPFLSVHTLSKKIRIPITVYASHIRPSCPIFTHQPPFPFPPISQSMGRVFGGCQTSVFDPIGEKFDRLVNWNWLLVKLWKNPKTCLNSIILGSLPYTWPLTHTSVLAAV